MAVTEVGWAVGGSLGSLISLAEYIYTLVAFRFYRSKRSLYQVDNVDGSPMLDATTLILLYPTQHQQQALQFGSPHHFFV